MPEVAEERAPVQLLVAGREAVVPVALDVPVRVDVPRVVLLVAADLDLLEAPLRQDGVRRAEVAARGVVAEAEARRVAEAEATEAEVKRKAAEEEARRRAAEAAAVERAKSVAEAQGVGRSAGDGDVVMNDEEAERRKRVRAAEDERRAQDELVEAQDRRIR